MEKTALEDVDNWMSPASVKRSLSNALGAEQCALNYYELEPGDAFGFGYHRHPIQEELFYVMEGTATFETSESPSDSERASGDTASEEGEVTVAEGEAIRFAPGEWQHGRNESDDTVRALAIGAPAETGDVDVRRDCPDCGQRRDVRIEPTAERTALVAICETCGTEVVRHS